MSRSPLRPAPAPGKTRQVPVVGKRQRLRPTARPDLFRPRWGAGYRNAIEPSRDKTLSPLADYLSSRGLGATTVAPELVWFPSNPAYPAGTDVKTTHFWFFRRDLIDNRAKTADAWLYRTHGCITTPSHTRAFKQLILGRARYWPARRSGGGRRDGRLFLRGSQGDACCSREDDLRREEPRRGFSD